MSCRHGMDVVVYCTASVKINWSRPSYSSSDTWLLEVGCPVTLKSELGRKKMVGDEQSGVM